MSELNDDIKKQIQKIFSNQKKIEISEKYHAEFFSEKSKGISPEIEAEWLEYIEEFEKQFEKATDRPLREFIGSPIIKNIDNMTIKEIENEYYRLVNLLNEYDIRLDFPIELNITTKYRFITEELINELIQDIHINGMQLHFDYEEYHPSENDKK
jgi:hypothetical protein